MDFDLSEAPETNKLVQDLTSILTQIEEDEELVRLKKTNYNAYKDRLYETKKFQPFIEKYFLLFTLITSPNPPPFEIIMMFINYKAKVETGRMTQEEADKEVAEFMNNKFVYPVFGSKEKMEETIRKRNKH